MCVIEKFKSILRTVHGHTDLYRMPIISETAKQRAHTFPKEEDVSPGMVMAALERMEDRTDGGEGSRL